METRAIWTAFLLLLVGFLVLFATASLIADANWRKEDQISANIVRVDNDNVIRLPNTNQALPSTEEGTLVVVTNPPVKLFDQFSDTRDYIIFFSATNLPGVRVAYDIKKKMFQVGTPLMSSQEINIFDEKPHQLAYSFKKEGKQALFIDGVKVNESDFEPMTIMSATGFAVAVSAMSEIDMKGIEVAMYDHSMQQSDLSKLN